MKNNKTSKPVFATCKRKKYMKEKTIFLSVSGQLVKNNEVVQKLKSRGLQCIY